MFTETWVSLDRESDRDESGRPGTLQRPRINIIRQDIDLDLSKIDTKSQYWEFFRTNAKFRSKVKYTAKEDGLRMIAIQLPGSADIKEIIAADGTSLPFTRKKIEKDQYATTSWILLDKPTVKGDLTNFTVVYEKMIYSFVSGQSWFPSLPDAPFDVCMFNLTVTHPTSLDFRAAGKLVKETVSGKMKTSVFNSEVPVMLFAFTMLRDIYEKSLKVDGLPEVTVCGQKTSYKKMVKNVGADIVNSLLFYQDYYGVKLPFEKICATPIYSSYGQAMRGFIHLSKLTFLQEEQGDSFIELFRAHEAAHFLWGYMVTNKTYRDYWLIEAFAEYSAMLYVQAAYPKKKYFNDILDARIGELYGIYKGTSTR
ncbi:MAG: M1 family metallopeptidase [bacterium]|nr:M1 family metallopeptidase [bacterium]